MSSRLQSLCPSLSEQSPEGHPHAFRPPVDSDSRGPCPALNTLANHGYLPRSGSNITAHDLLAALQNPDTYNISQPLADLLVYGGLALMHKLDGSSITLHDLALHGCIEHDASLVHKNADKGQQFAPCRCDTKMLNDLLEENSLTLEMVAKRRVILERVTPLDRLHQAIARGEWALVLDIFGREHGGHIQSGIMRDWLEKNKFPEGWRPSHQQSLAATIWKASEIRQKMNEIRTQYEESSDECAGEVNVYRM